MKTLILLFILTTSILFNHSTTYSTPLNGIYTIGSGGSYPTINSAATDAEINGVSGPVVFNVLPGIYTEQIIIDFIPGSDINNTVTFRSQGGNPANVIIKSNGNFILRINGAENIVIDGLTFSKTYSFVKIELQNNCSNIKLINNVFTRDQGAGNVGRDIVGEGNFRLDNILIEGNIFNPELEQIKISTDAVSSNIRIINNTLLEGTATNILVPQSVLIQNCDSVLIEKNNIGTAYRGGGIGLRGCKYFKILKNIIGGEGWGIIINSSGISNTESIIANNFFLNSTEIYFSSDILITFNSIKGAGVSVASSNDISLINNIYSMGSIGYAMFINNSIVYSDYNNFDGPAIMFYYLGIYYSNLTAYRNASNLDQHSGDIPVNFVSATDLHLTGTSIGDELLLGIPNPLITDDIDGDHRDFTFPYKGADELDVLLPVELSSFTSLVTGSNVKLNWITSIENNNSGFDIERSDVKNQKPDGWSRIGFVKGNGTASSPNSYEFTDRGLNTGKYQYRLKQIDYNGSYKYFNLSQEVVIGAPEKFSLSQNYPNPFNPVTRIEYSIPSAQYTKLKVYDINGKEVASLVNQLQNAGSYSVEFNAGNFVSGQYFYKIESENYSEVKKMILLK